MPALLAPLLGILIGALMAWAAHGTDTDRPTVQTQGFLTAALFGVLVFAPINAYFLAFYGDWSFGYLLATGRESSSLSLGLVLLDAAIVPATLWVCEWLSHKERSRQSSVKLASPVALLATLVIVVSYPRLSVSTTVAGFVGKFGMRAVAGTDLGYALLWMGLVLALAVAWTVRVLRAER